MTQNNTQLKIKPKLKQQAYAILTGNSDNYLSQADAALVLDYNYDYAYRLNKKVRTGYKFKDGVVKGAMKTLGNVANCKPPRKGKDDPTIDQSLKAAKEIVDREIPKKQEIDITEKKTVAFVDLTRYVGYKASNMIANEFAQQQLIELPKDTEDTQTD